MEAAEQVVLKCADCRTKKRILNTDLIYFKDNHQCSFCGKTVEIEPNNQHLKFCRICKSFVESSIFQNHHKVLHPKDAPKNHKCSYCQKVFGRKSSLTEHIDRIHLKITNHQCDECSHAFLKRYC